MESGFEDVDERNPNIRYQYGKELIRIGCRLHSGVSLSLMLASK